MQMNVKILKAGANSQHFNSLLTAHGSQAAVYDVERSNTLFGIKAPGSHTVVLIQNAMCLW